jgi:7-cyano-7-deazaguanine synthase in queuosine biosynthesis
MMSTVRSDVMQKTQTGYEQATSCGDCSACCLKRRAEFVMDERNPAVSFVFDRDLEPVDTAVA